MNHNPIAAMRAPAVTPLSIPAVSLHHLLVVEDDTSLRRLSTDLLIRSGYEVDTAEDGAAAWEVLQTDRYDLMITDNNMPNLTGIELLKKLYAARMAIPFIMASGKMPEEEFSQCPWLQPAAKLFKPYTVQELLGTVKAALRDEDEVQPFTFRDRRKTRLRPMEASAGVPRHPPTNPPPRILVVDDDSDTRQLSVDVLVGSGYDVDAVIDGAAGWEALQSARYDLAITDNTMPRMTGIEMIEQLRSAHMAVPVIMATGHLPLNEFSRRPWLKPDALLQRPITNDELLDAVKKVLGPDHGLDEHKEAPVPQPA